MHIWLATLSASERSKHALPAAIAPGKWERGGGMMRACFATLNGGLRMQWGVGFPLMMGMTMGASFFLSFFLSFFFAPGNPRAACGCGAERRERKRGRLFRYFWELGVGEGAAGAGGWGEGWEMDVRVTINGSGRETERKREKGRGERGCGFTAGLSGWGLRLRLGVRWDRILRRGLVGYGIWRGGGVCDGGAGLGIVMMGIGRGMRFPLSKREDLAEGRVRVSVADYICLCRLRGEAVWAVFGV